MNHNGAMNRRSEREELLCIDPHTYISPRPLLLIPILLTIVLQNSLPLAKFLCILFLFCKQA